MRPPVAVLAARRRMLRFYPVLVLVGAALFLPNADVINSGTALGLFFWLFAVIGAARDADKTEWRHRWG